MRLDIPLDLPGHSFVDQLKWLEGWACLDASTLTKCADDLATAAKNEPKDFIAIICECVNHAPWQWPDYTDYEEENGRFFSGDLLKDMAEHIYSKYRSNKMAIYRKSQIDAIKHLRPYWSLSGRCASDDDSVITLDADDAFWETHCVPWNCEKLDCRCRVSSLSEYEMRNSQAQ